MLCSPVEEKGPTLSRFFSDAEDNDHVARSPRRRPADTVRPDTTTILVVDDDLANLALAEALLEAEGFKVRVAMDAKSMFAAMKTAKPAVILMDIQLPEVDGWELTKQLRADPSTSGIPVIAITAYGKAGDEKKARRAGFAEYLSKPVSTRELPAIIRRHLPTR